MILSQFEQMSWKHTVLKLCSRLIPDIYHPPAGVLFPYAHIVSDTPPLHVRHLYGVPKLAKFKSDIDFLCRRCRPLHLSDLERIPRLRSNKGSVRAFVLSFDDGMREVYDVIAPILREKGIPAIFFLNAPTIDNRQLMWRHKISLLTERSQKQPARIPPQISLRPGESVHARLKALRFADEHTLDEVASFFELDFGEYLRSARPYLTTDQVLELARAGFEFGAHSASHPYFNEMTVEGQKDEILRSVGFIRSLGLPCRYFAFPFHDNGVPGSVFRYMTDLELVLSFGTSEARVDSIGFSFQRFALDADNANSSIQDLLKQLSVRSVAYRFSGTETIQRN
jgi:peptidoglycan/xylan/chitin deacetylase (PgdA/CDA1 family)